MIGPWIAKRRASVLVLAGLMTVPGCSPPPGERPEPARLSVATSLGSGALAGFARALEPRDLVFPEDHGPHPDFKTEWWYWIGNLATPEGRRFGYQLTFFRTALATPASELIEAEAVSSWSTRQLYMAHFAVSDIDSSIDGAGFRSFERFSRGAAGLAGVRAAPFRVWLEDWSVEAVDASEGEWKLSARAGSAAIELTLEPGKPRVPHGDRGLSRKGDLPGAGSYYYSRTRMPTRGRIDVDGDELEVCGESWFDHEWSTSALAEDEVGWDWLGARLDDGREVMFFRLRRRDGSSTRVGGTLVAADGEFRRLRTEGLELLPQGAWTSPETGITYPAAFRLELPGEGLSLDIRPLLADQELRHSFLYWEGAVEISGPTPGLGYLEMTGYCTGNKSSDGRRRSSSAVTNSVIRRSSSAG